MFSDCCWTARFGCPLTFSCAQLSAEPPHCFSFSSSSSSPPFVLRLVFLEIIGCFLKSSSSAPSFSLVLSVCLNTWVCCLCRTEPVTLLKSSRSSYSTLWSLLGLRHESFWGSRSVGTAFLRSLSFLFWVYRKFAEAYFLEVGGLCPEFAY